MSVPPQKLMLLFYGRNNGKLWFGRILTASSRKLKNGLPTPEVAYEYG